MLLNKRQYVGKINEDLAHLSNKPTKNDEKSSLDTHFKKHKNDFDVKTPQEYNEKIVHVFTSHPAKPIEEIENDVVYGYINQSGSNIKFTNTSDKGGFITAYVRSPITGKALTCYAKPLKNILQDADPYSPYPIKLKDGDYRYKSDLNGDIKGLEFFNNHPEYHKDVDKEVIEEIRHKIENGEKLNKLNTF